MWQNGRHEDLPEYCFQCKSYRVIASKGYCEDKDILFDDKDRKSCIYPYLGSVKI